MPEPSQWRRVTQAPPVRESWRAHLVQATPDVGNLKGNLARVVDELQRARADLIVFPELFLSGYVMKDELATCAFGLDEEPVRVLAEACARTGKHLVVGFPRKTATRGVLTNCLLFVGPEGVIGHYDKVYLPTFGVFEEHHWFKEGDRLPVFETALGKVGLAICYDLFFPEVTKALALQGADVIVCASASPTPSRRYFEAVFPARAIETTCFLLYANVTGPQDVIEFWGGCQAWGPRGDLKAKAPYDVAHALEVEVDLSEVDEARKRRPALRDTRQSVLETLARARSEPE